MTQVPQGGGQPLTPKQLDQILQVEGLSDEFGRDLPLANQDDDWRRWVENATGNLLLSHLWTAASLVLSFTEQSRCKGKQLYLSRFRSALARWRTLEEATRPPVAKLPPKPRRPITSRVYFVRVGDFIKIGFTTNLGKRLKALATGAAVVPVVVHSEAGTLNDERNYHRRFAQLRANGEWFRLEAELATFLEGVRA